MKVKLKLYNGVKYNPQNKPIENVKKALNLPDNMIPLNIIYLGYPKEQLEAKDHYKQKKITYIKQRIESKYQAR